MIPHFPIGVKVFGECGRLEELNEIQKLDEDNIKDISSPHHIQYIHSHMAGVATVTVRAHTAAAAHVHSQAAPSPDLARQYFPYMFVVDLLCICLHVIGAWVMTTIYSKYE